MLPVIKRSKGNNKRNNLNVKSRIKLHYPFTKFNGVFIKAKREVKLPFSKYTLNDLLDGNRFNTWRRHCRKFDFSSPYFQKSNDLLV